MCGNSGVFHGSILHPSVSKPFSGYNSAANRNRDAAAAAAQAAADSAINDANAALMASRQRRRGSALATGAPDSTAGALTSSAMTYGKPTLGA